MQEQVTDEQVLLDVKRLRKFFPIRAGMMRHVQGYVRAVDDVSFQVKNGETISLVGESGCGKTTTARCILRAYEPTAGELLFRTDDGSMVDMAKLSLKELKPLRRQVQMIFQDPFSSLNPRMTLLNIIGEPLVVNKVAKGDELRDRVAELMHLVGLRPEFMQRYPHAFSGGQRQRIGIARALALNPVLIVADEPVSALDVSVQAQILNLLLDLQEQFGLTLIFVAHDLSVVKHISERVAVMYVGKIVEIAETITLFNTPLHPYTEALMLAVPQPDPRLRSRRAALQGDVADPSNPPPGCYFHPRCKYAQEICETEPTQLLEVEPGHFVSCHRAAELDLAGVEGGAAA